MGRIKFLSELSFVNVSVVFHCTISDFLKNKNTMCLYNLRKCFSNNVFDAERATKVASLFKGVHDFRTFMSISGHNKSKVYIDTTLLILAIVN